MTSNNVNQNIPKYIVNRPWYEGSGKDKDSDDYLAHHRKDGLQIVDYSLAQPGSGIDETEIRGEDTFDAKRDRWHGYDLDDWQRVLDNWKDKEKVDNNDENPDYELELLELGLTSRDIKRNIKENSLERTVRDRQDIASYIFNITSNPDNKISLDASNSKNNVASVDDDQFVRKTDDINAVKLQKFAWDLKKKDDEVNKSKILDASLTNDSVEVEVNLEHNLEASPTLMMLKQKKHQQELKEKVDLKKRKLHDLYGGDK